MNCRYCRAWNHEEEHRCTRCGRRLHLANARPALDTYPIQTATAPELLGLARSLAEDAGPVPEPEPQPVRVSYQRPLFREMQQVMTIPVLRPSEPVVPARPQRHRRTSRRVDAAQQAFELHEPRVRTSLEAVIYSDAPVASPVHRMLAAALDMSMVVIALGMFLITFQIAGGQVVLNKETVPLFLGIAVVFGFFYHVLFCLGNSDTPGMRWTQLQLLNFDGRLPDRDQRSLRLAANCLSLLAAGLGLLWSLVDEEKLAWHDHMSRTFPSPRRSRIL